MSHLKALVFSTAMINFLILTTYQLFYGGSQSIKYHANLNFEVLKESSLGKNSIIHRGHKQVEEQIERAEIEQVQEKALEELEDFIEAYIDKGIDDTHYNDGDDAPEFEHSHHGIINENICKQSNNYFSSNSKAITKQTIVTDVDIQVPSASMFKIGEFTTIPPNVTLFWTKDLRFHYFHLIGKNFLCNFQKYNHIPGHVVYRQYNKLEEATRTFQSKLKNPRCMLSPEVFPQTYMLHQKEECEAYFQSNHSGRAEFVIDSAENVYPASKEIRKRVLNKYKNGTKCGEIDEIVLVRTTKKPIKIEQEFLRIDFIMLLASTQPMIVYVSNPYYRWNRERLTKEEVDRNLQNVTNQTLSDQMLMKQIDQFTIDFTRIVWNKLLHDHRVFEVLNMTFLLNKHLEPIFESLEITPTLDQDLLLEILEIEQTFQKNLVLKSQDSSEKDYDNSGDHETNFLHKVVDFGEDDPFLGKLKIECI